MRRHFTSGLLACISEARPPSPRELAALARQVRQEAFGDRRDSDRRMARRIAEAALAGWS